MKIGVKSEGSGSAFGSHWRDCSRTFDSIWSQFIQEKLGMDMTELQEFLSKQNELTEIVKRVAQQKEKALAVAKGYENSYDESWSIATGQGVFLSEIIVPFLQTLDQKEIVQDLIKRIKSNDLWAESPLEFRDRLSKTIAEIA